MVSSSLMLSVDLCGFFMFNVECGSVWFLQVLMLSVDLCGFFMFNVECESVWFFKVSTHSQINGDNTFDVCLFIMFVCSKHETYLTVI